MEVPRFKWLYDHAASENALPLKMENAPNPPQNPTLAVSSLPGRARQAVAPSAWCLQGPWPHPSFHRFPGNNGFGGPDEYWSSSSRWLYFICWPHKQGCWRAECQPRPLRHVMECYQKATRLALSFLLNKQLNHSLLVIKILSRSHVL